MEVTLSRMQDVGLILLDFATKEKLSGHDVFFNYHPHTNGFSIASYGGRWSVGKTQIVSETIYLEYDTDEDIQNKIQKIKNAK